MPIANGNEAHIGIAIVSWITIFLRNSKSRGFQRCHLHGVETKDIKEDEIFHMHCIML